MIKETSTNPVTEQFEDMLHIRMAPPGFTLKLAEVIPEQVTEPTQIFIDHLLDLGFIYTHEITVTNAVGKPEGIPGRILSYAHVDKRVYALISDLYHTDSWVQFTSYFPEGQRIVTTSQPGAMQLEAVQQNDNNDLTLQNAGSTTVDAQWKKHQRLAAGEMPDATALIFEPEQHLAVEKSYYLRYVQQLLSKNILQQSDTQTVRFTRSGARAYHVALHSRSARLPKPAVEQWIGKRGKLPLKRHVTFRKTALAATALLGIGIAIITLKPVENADPTIAAVDSKNIETKQLDSSVANTTTDQLLTADGPDNAEVSPDPLAASTAESQPEEIPVQSEKDKKQLIIATNEDEMWRIAVENAEFFLLSNDGDPTPWIRSARKIAGGFKSNDSRLARTYFLSALLESDYRIAEQQFNRALSIQTKTLGLYHAETAQTLEALAWIAEHNKEALDEAITHQRLAINIYRDIFGPNAEDTKAAQWKLEYFEDRLAGLRPKAESNRRLLPALARFSR